jgi:hypothetical protein
MTHTPKDKDKIALQRLLMAYKKMSNAGKRALLVAMIMETPDTYKDFLDALDKKEYENILSVA